MKKVGVLLIILILGITLATFITSRAINKKTLPILNPCNVNPTLVDSAIQAKCIGHKIGPFSFVNQHGKIVDQGFIKNKIAVVDFFFVSCPSICPIMTSQLKRIHDYDFGALNNQVVLLSHTVWPEADSVPVLNQYASQYGANADRWSFLTGDKKALYTMARKSYLIVPDVSTPWAQTDWILTPNRRQVSLRRDHHRDQERGQCPMLRVLPRPRAREKGD